MFTCGPCPVRAIRNGDLYLGYDTKFLFAEVNGDRVFWTVDSEGNMTPVFKDCDAVGKFMSTKAVNTISRDDVTSKYKHEAGIRVLPQFGVGLVNFWKRTLIYKKKILKGTSVCNIFQKKGKSFICTFLNIMTWSQ